MKFKPVTPEQIGEVSSVLCSYADAATDARRQLVVFVNPRLSAIRYEVTINGRTSPYLNFEAALHDYNDGLSLLGATLGPCNICGSAKHDAKEHLIQEAFLDVMNGTSSHDIRGLTGLPEERCQEIYSLYSELLNK